MSENFPKYILVFLGGIYLISGVAEVIMVKNGAEMFFQATDKLVPHMAMFILGFYFSRK